MTSPVDEGKPSVPSEFQDLGLSRDHLRPAPDQAHGGGLLVAPPTSLSFPTQSQSDHGSRKRPLETLSPLQSPLFSFLPSPPPPMMTTALDSSRLEPASRPVVATPQAYASSPSCAAAGPPLVASSARNSLKVILQVPPSMAKRPRRDVLVATSPTSVGDVSTSAPSRTVEPPTPVALPRAGNVASARPPAAPSGSSSASSDKIRSVVRGLEHVSRCPPALGCGNPLCVSTRAFMNKVSAHLVAMRAKPSHRADKCGACQLWLSIVRAHASICMEVHCPIPLCSAQQEPPSSATAATSAMLVADDGACRREGQRRDDAGEHAPHRVVVLR